MVNDAALSGRTGKNIDGRKRTVFFLGLGKSDFVFLYEHNKDV